LSPRNGDVEVPLPRSELYSRQDFRNLVANLPYSRATDKLTNYEDLYTFQQGSRIPLGRFTAGRGQPEENRGGRSLQDSFRGSSNTKVELRGGRSLLEQLSDDWSLPEGRRSDRNQFGLAGKKAETFRHPSTGHEANGESPNVRIPGLEFENTDDGMIEESGMTTWPHGGDGGPNFIHRPSQSPTGQVR
jgi:hypothetical protein